MKVKYVKISREDLLPILPEPALRGVIAEVGVLKGQFSQHIWTKMDPKRLILMDCWGADCPVGVNPNRFFSLAQREEFEQQLRQTFKKQISKGNILMIPGYSRRTLPMLRDASLDMMFIDADHTEEAALEDLIQARRLVREPGLILCHDFTPKFGVFNAVQRFLSDNPEYRMAFATDEPYSTAVLSCGRKTLRVLDDKATYRQWESRTVEVHLK